MIFLSIFLFTYTLLVSILVFSSQAWVGIFFLLLHILLLKVLGLNLKKIFKPILRLIPFLAFILLASIFFTVGNDLLTSINIFSWKINLTYSGFYNGITACLAFVAIASVTPFYQLQKIEESFISLSHKVPFLTPLFLVQKYFGHTKVRTKSPKTKIAPSKNALSRYLNEAILDISEFLKSQKLGVNSEKMLVITAVSILLMSTKFTKILPGMPFASGQKLLLVTPLLFFTAKKYGFPSATITALNFGILTLMFGQQGQLGVFETARTVILGILVDLATPFIPKKEGFLLLSSLVGLGGIIGFFYAGFTIFLATLIRVPGLIFLLAIPRFLSNIFFGGLSGTLTYYLQSEPFLKRIDKSIRAVKIGKSRKKA